MKQNGVSWDESLKNDLCLIWQCTKYTHTYTHTSTYKSHSSKVDYSFFTKENLYKSDLDGIRIFIRYRGNFDISLTQRVKKTGKNIINFIVFYFSLDE